MKNEILKPVIKGALLLFPIIITVWLVWTLVIWIDDLGRKTLKPFLLDHLIFPGSGLIIVFLILFLIGLLFQFSIFKLFFTQVEKNFLKFPLVNTLYSSIKDLANMFENKNDQDKQVVLVNLESMGLGNVIGIITNQKMQAFDQSIQSNDDHLMAVYLPMSYMVGGFTIVIEKSKLIEVEMTFEEAMRFALTAGVSQSTSN
ncbi:DUF502 domain-containing protein [Marinicella litoralis]|uniref:Putative membrane protein n=1 Tax=Marinicella litoralis TaxID=644220 RepID=A0A4R6XRZ6_9GAMM|nr:DUF502 domain-containing protein [Marinicella litoralis]TDR20707.1 putative membrane protein [Marinicella litoralis]